MFRQSRTAGNLKTTLTMQKYLHILSFMLLLAACSSDDYVGDVNPTEHPITLGGNGGMVTRAGGVGLETYLPNDNKNILFYGIKNTATSGSPQWQDVFQNYVLQWQTNTAGTSTSNSSDWEYVGLTSVGPYNTSTGNYDLPTTQTIKYWDYSASAYNFFAVAPLDRNNPIVGNTPDAFSYTVDVRRDNPTYFTRVQNVPSAQYGKTVTLQFQSLLSKVRVGLYETIPGYEITGLTFYLDDAPLPKPRRANADPASPKNSAGTFSQPVLNGVSREEFAASGTYTISQNASNSEMKIDFEPSYGDSLSSTLAVATPMSTGEYPPFVSNPDVRKPVEGEITENEDTTQQRPNQRCPIQYFYDKQGNIVETLPVLGQTSSWPTMGYTEDGTGYVPVLSNPNVAHELSIKCDYTLRSSSYGSNDVITIKGQTAKVPVQYGTWRPNYAYTYLFKITDDGSGLYPLSFDACVETFADNDDGTVTIVQKPSITTWQYEAVHQGDVTNPAKDVEYVLATSRSDDQHDIDVEVSTKDVTGATGMKLEVCYYGPQVTEGEFEYYDKQARNGSKLPSTDPNHVEAFVWAPIAAADGATLTPAEYGYRRSTTEVRNTTALMNSVKRADISAGQPVHSATVDGKYPYPTYNDGTFKFGTFRPLLGGYYAIRFTYKITVEGKETQLYAYKIVKIGEYSFLEPTIQINDNYHNGVVIE